jgi:hypothetical protein
VLCASTCVTKLTVRVILCCSFVLEHNSASVLHRAGVLVDVLLIASQLARLHKDDFATYEQIAKANVYAHIRRCVAGCGTSCRAGLLVVQVMDLEDSELSGYESG